MTYVKHIVNGGVLEVAYKSVKKTNMNQDLMMWSPINFRIGNIKSLTNFIYVSITGNDIRNDHLYK